MNYFYTNNVISAGSENYPFQLVSGEMPDEIYLPGTVTLTTKVNVLEQLPEDLIIEMKLKKLEPFPMEVPCLNGLGSWWLICNFIIHVVRLNWMWRPFYSQPLRHVPDHRQPWRCTLCHVSSQSALRLSDFRRRVGHEGGGNPNSGFRAYPWIFDGGDIYITQYFMRMKRS